MCFGRVHSRFAGQHLLVIPSLPASGLSVALYKAQTLRARRAWSKMGRGGAIHLSYAALVLLSQATGSSAGLWTVDINHSPAPPAESGPPFSAHASRDRDLLPYQVVGVVSAYVGSVLIIGTLLLTWGRKLRKRALSMVIEKPTELVKPTKNMFDINSPSSPVGSVRGWIGRKKRTADSIRSGRSTLRSPGGASVATFDDNVVEQHKARQKDDLARVYGAVFEHEDSTAPPYSAEDTHSARAKSGPLRHLDMDRVRDAGGPSARSPQSPTSPYHAKNVLAQLSPRYKLDAPRSPMHETSDSRAASHGNRTIDSSPGKLRKKFVNLNLSNIGSPIKSLRDNDDGAREPLSPKLYTNPGAPPPEPPSTRTAETFLYSPTTPGTGRSFAFTEEEEHFDHVRDLPSAHPQRRPGLSSESQPPLSPSSPGLPSSPAQFRVGSPPRRGPAAPAGNIDRPLALRQFNEQQKQMQQSTVSLASPTTARHFPLSPVGAWNTRAGGLLSPPIQQTVLHTKGMDRGLTTPGGTLEQLPYSPYFPNQLVTPVTPHFTTRAERKQKEKEEKSTRGAITEEDQVKDDKDLWRDGYD